MSKHTAHWRIEAQRAVAHHFKRRHEYGNAPAKAWARVLREWMPVKGVD